MTFMRRSSLSAAVALRQLGQRAQTKAGPVAEASKPVFETTSLDLSISPPARFRQIAAATRVVPAEQVPCASTRNPLNPSLLSAQAKDAALLTKVADDFLSMAGSNFQLEITFVQYEQAMKPGVAFSLDELAALSLARGASFSH